MKFAILGCGHIATKMAAAVKCLEQKGMGVEAYAVASRTQAKADDFAQQYGFLLFANGDIFHQRGEHEVGPAFLAARLVEQG